MPYVERITRAGKTIEVERYFTSRYKKPGIKRGDKVRPTKEEQKKVNTRAAERKLRLLLNANFGYGDYHLELDYIRKKGQLDRSREQMRKDMDIFLRELRKECKKAGIELKYVHVMEIGKRGARHHHLVINKIDTEILQRCYRRGYRVLLIDNDKQGNLSKAYSRYDAENIAPVTKLLAGDWNSVDELIQHTEYEGIDIVTANMSLFGTTWNLTKEDSENQIERYKALVYAKVQYYGDCTVYGKYDYAYTQGAAVYVKDVEVLGQMSVYTEAQLKINSDSITQEVKRAKGIEDELRASIKVNAENITSCVTKGNVGSYITQYYNNVIVAFNNSSKYVQINAGEIAIYDYGVSASKKRAVFDEQGNHFYRDNYYVGKIGTNQWVDNNAHKGLVFDLETQGKYMAWAQKPTEGASSYTTILCYSRANSIFTQVGLHLGCNMYGHGWILDNVDLRNCSANGYTTFTGTLPVVLEIHKTDNNGGIGWTYGNVYIKNGLITSIPQ